MNDDAGASTEREITELVSLCTGDGRLAPDAVGWSRRPVHDCALPASWGRRKRWDFWGVTGPGCALDVVVADVDYVGLADVWFRDFTAGAEVAKAVTVPLARGISLPDRVGGGPIVVDRDGLRVSIVEDAGGTRLRVAFGGSGGRGGAEVGGEAGAGFRADVLMRRPEGHESLSVVIPWSDRRFQCTTKDVARPAEGTVVWDGRTYELRPDGTAWGCLDFGRGKWPYRTVWNWGAGAGVVAGPDGPVPVGLQLGGKWTDGTGMTENALCVDGRLSKLSEELVWRYDTADWLRPWAVRTPRSGRVDLTFTPVHDKRSRLQLGVVSQSVGQCFGTWSGTIVPDTGQPLTVDGLFGWAEEATWRWKDRPRARRDERWSGPAGAFRGGRSDGGRSPPGSVATARVGSRRRVTARRAGAGGQAIGEPARDPRGPERHRRDRGLSTSASPLLTMPATSASVGMRGCRVRSNTLWSWPLGHNQSGGPYQKHRG